MTSDQNADMNVLALVTQMKVNSLKDREIYLWGEVDENEELIINRWLEKLVKNDLAKGLEKKPIRINISSPGGSVFSGLSIISQLEELREFGYDIHTYSYGMCMSAALHIYMVGTHRFSQRHTRFMLHQPSAGNHGYSSVESSKRMHKELDELWERIKMLTKTYTKISDELLEQISSGDQDYYFFPERGVELGFVDAII